MNHGAPDGACTPGDSETPGAGWHCLQCEYDLRGHVGDPITCPECGFVNEIGELKAAARLTDKDIAPYETAPTMAIVWFWLFSLGFYFLTRGWWVAGAIFCVPTAMLWIVAVRRFHERLRGEPGIWDALLWFHITAGLVVLGMGLLVVISFPLSGLGTRWLSEVLPLGISCAVIVLLGKLGNRYHPYRIAKRKLRRLAILAAVKERRATKTASPRHGEA